MKCFDFLTDYRLGIFNRYWWKDFWYNQISSRLFPRNKWATKLIPRTWIDKDILLERVVIGSLLHYVDIDGEDCFGHLDTETSLNQDFWKELRHYHELASKKLPSLENELKAAWKKIPPTNFCDINNGNRRDYEKTYGTVDRLEKEIENLKTEIMVWTIKRREYLWT